MKTALLDAIRKALDALGVEPEIGIEIEVPRDESFGDLSTPVAMGLAKVLKKPPRKIAEEIADNIPTGSVFGKVEVAGPGFVNFTFNVDFLHLSFREMVAKGGDILGSDMGQGRRVQIEFVSANPTGPLHLGHGRGAAVGNALANILEAAGYSVEREYYVNDAGRQVGLLGQCVFAHYKRLHGLDWDFPEEGYAGEYVRDIAKAAIETIGEKYLDERFEDVEEYFVDFSLNMMMDVIRKDLDDFGVRFDRWQSERELLKGGNVRHAVDYLSERGLIYESEGALWFRATEFGDEKDRVVFKSDGRPTYFASDIAYHLNKIERGFDEIINIWGADHHGYVPRMEAVIDALGRDRKMLKVLLVQMVSLERAGKPVQMSKRAGEFVTLREVSEEVGPDTTKFIFLTRRHDSHLGFDIEAAKASSAENPVYYVQYANARINSIFMHAEDSGIRKSEIECSDLGLLNAPDELRIIKKLLLCPVVFEQAAANREPHRLTFCLQELAGMFHPYYNRYRVVTEDSALTLARLALCEAVRLVLSEGLRMLGLTAPESM
jgi:arginyl-tRNA synthetase